MERLNPILNAICTPTPDLARAEAKRIEAAIMAGETVGPLAGVPTGDQGPGLHQGHPHRLRLLGLRRFHSRRGRRRRRTAQRAGAIMIGKTNVPEFGYSGTGQTPSSGRRATRGTSPRTSGGSSRGLGAPRWRPGSGRSQSAATAAARSASRPASAASTASRPRWAACRSTRLPSDERYPACPAGSRSSTSARSAAPSPTSALMLSVIAGPDDRDRTACRPTTVDWLGATDGGIARAAGRLQPGLGLRGGRSRVRAIVDRAVAVFERDLGCTVEGRPRVRGPLRGVRAHRAPRATSRHARRSPTSSATG